MATLEPITRNEKFYKAIADSDSTGLPEPKTREELFLNAIATGNKEGLPEPVTRREIFLREIAENGGGDVTIEPLTATENGTYSEEGKAYKPVVVNVATPENAYLLKSATDGDIVTFTDGANLPMPSLKVGIEPQQDLHGYDNPWVGGAGKNKFKTDFENTTINGTTITKTSDGRVLTSGVPTSAFDFVIGHVSLPAGSYILNGCPANGSADKYRLQVTDYPVVNNLGLDYGSGVSFTLEHDMEIAVRIQVYTGARATLEYKPMIRLATVSDVTFAPYSNICPISGHTEGNVVVSPTTDAEDGTTYTVQFKDGDNPLTVYGGRLDVVSGVLTVDRAIVDLGTLNWIYNSAYHYFVGQVANRAIRANNIVSDRYAVTTETFDGNQQDGEIKASRSNLNVFVSNYSYTDATAFKNAMVGSQLCYELATPQTYQLTPTLVKSLLNTNNVWHSCNGGITDLTYFSKA